MKQHSGRGTRLCRRLRNAVGGHAGAGQSLDGCVSTIVRQLPVLDTTAPALFSFSRVLHKIMFPNKWGHLYLSSLPHS